MCRIIAMLGSVLMLLVTGYATAGQGIWQDATSLQAQVDSPDSKIHQFSADHVALRNKLSFVPHESSRDFSQQIDLPMPDGSLASFSIVESPVMKPGLAAKYPEIKTFKVYGIDDPMASGRVDITPQGFHAMLFTAKGRLFIDPDHTSAQAGQYLSRYRSGQPSQEFSCGMHKLNLEDEQNPEVSARLAARTPSMLLEYDLAVAATAEYVARLGGTVTLAQAGIVTAIARVNAIYERDLGIRLMLVDDNDQLIENVGDDIFSNGNILALLNENQAWLDSQSTKLGFEYDIGHVFGTGFGGVAVLGSACNVSSKAKATSSRGFLADDSFYIDYVAHEIGHQFSAEHSFNGTTSSCSGDNRNSLTAFEPGSGSTIMSYAGICEQENLQFNSDATFHAGSIAQIDGFTQGSGNCAVEVATNDPASKSDPTIAVIPDRVIPANTPFVLDGTAMDVDMNTLSYQWDQMDAGCPTDLTTFGTDNGSNALFRSYVPRGESWRNFPALGTQVQGRFDKAEVLPCQNRDLDFRLTARDGNSGQDFEDVRVSVNNSAGPFRITNLDPAPPIYAGTPFAVNWDVANTHLTPINCVNVDIDLISFSPGYARYSILPLATTPNIAGTALVTINPVTAFHPRSRVRVKCSDNIFYDLSDTDLTVEATMGTPVSLDDDDFAAYSFVNGNLAQATVAPACGLPVECTSVSAVKSSGKSGGSGAFDYLWLLMMTGVVALVKWHRRYGVQ